MQPNHGCLIVSTTRDILFEQIHPPVHVPWAGDDQIAALHFDAEIAGKNASQVRHETRRLEAVSAQLADDVSVGGVRTHKLHHRLVPDARSATALVSYEFREANQLGGVR
jgi:hypothetical protein